MYSDSFLRPEGIPEKKATKEENAWMADRIQLKESIQRYNALM